MARVMWQEAEKILNQVPVENGFRCADGRVICSLAQLEDAFAGMSADTFTQHVSAERNEFADWVRNVIGDKQLAVEIFTQRNRAHSAKSIARRIFFLRSHLS